MTGVLIRRVDKDTDMHRRKKSGLRQRQKTAVYKARREVSEETNPTHTFISDF